MKKYLCAAIMFAALAANTACRQQTGETFKPAITGRNGEVLLVINDDVKRDTAGQFLLGLLAEPVVGLPALEPIFDVQTVPNGFFDGDRTMHSFRNIIVTMVSDTVTAPDVQFFDEVWAKQQAVAIARAKSKTDLLAVLDSNALKIVSYFSRHERNRLISFNTRTRHIPLSESVRKRWGVELTIPNTFSEGKSKQPETVQWLLIDADAYQAGLLIYSFPFDGRMQSIEKEQLVAVRDSVLGANIEGPQGSHMTTETRFGLDEIIYKYGKQGGMNAAEIRGLWRMDGYPMGGPFVMRAVIDEENQRVLVTDGYVYYPAKDRKRNIIRQLESVMYTLKKTKNDQD